MKYALVVMGITLTLLSSVAFAVLKIERPIETAKAGKYTVQLGTPAPPHVGDNHIVLFVKDGDKHVTGADISLHLDMVGMAMPADVKATPGAQDGQYVATVNLGMTGQWKLTVNVQAMAGMTMDGDGKATFTVTAKQAAGSVSGNYNPTAPIQPAKGLGLVWLIIGVLVLVGIVIVIVTSYGRPKQTPGS